MWNEITGKNKAVGKIVNILPPSVGVSLNDGIIIRMHVHLCLDFTCNGHLSPHKIYLCILNLLNKGT